MYTRINVHQNKQVRKIATEYIANEQWAEAFANLSNLEQKVMAVIGAGTCSRAEIAEKAMIDITGADNVILKLTRGGLIEVDRVALSGKRFKISSLEMAEYCKSIDKSFIWRDAIDRVKLEVYELTARRFQSLEYLGLIVGNGHHMAQTLSETVSKELQDRWISR